MFATRDLALYGAIVGTLSGLWALYASIILDRARIRVSVTEGHAISPATNQRTPVLMVRVSNRGRRSAGIQTVSRVVNMRRSRDTYALSADIMGQLVNPPRLGEGEGHTFVHGNLGGYELGGMPTRRWCVVDGGGRTHPLRERWRQRIERVVFWPWRWVDARRQKRG